MTKVENGPDYIRDYEGVAFGTPGGEIVSTIEERAVKKLVDISPNEVFLDIGTGSGRMVQEVVKSRAKVIGIDTCPEMIAQALTKKRAQRLDGYEIIMADAQYMPFKDKSFEGIICIRVLKWIPHYQKAIREMARTIKPKGRLILDVANKFSWEILLRLPILIKTHKLGSPTLFRVYQVKKVLRHNHFEVVESLPLHKFPLTVWNWFKNSTVLKILFKVDSLLKQVTPQEFLSRSILIKCISKKNS